MLTRKNRRLKLLRSHIIVVVEMVAVNKQLIVIKIQWRTLITVYPRGKMRSNSQTLTTTIQRPIPLTIRVKHSKMVVAVVVTTSRATTARENRPQVMT